MEIDNPAVNGIRRTLYLNSRSSKFQMDGCVHQLHDRLLQLQDCQLQLHDCFLQTMACFLQLPTRPVQLPVCMIQWQACLLQTNRYLSIMCKKTKYSNKKSN